MRSYYLWLFSVLIIRLLQKILMNSFINDTETKAFALLPNMSCNSSLKNSLCSSPHQWCLHNICAWLILVTFFPLTAQLSPPLPPSFPSPFPSFYFHLFLFFLKCMNIVFITLLGTTLYVMNSYYLFIVRLFYSGGSRRVLIFLRHFYLTQTHSGGLSSVLIIS